MQLLNYAIETGPTVVCLYHQVAPSSVNCALASSPSSRFIAVSHAPSLKHKVIYRYQTHMYIWMKKKDTKKEKQLLLFGIPPTIMQLEVVSTTVLS